MEKAVLSLISEFIKLGTAVLWYLARLLGWITVKKRWQRKADLMRTTCLISLPRDVSYDETLAFVRSLSGLPGAKALSPVYAVSLETYADAHGIKHYLSIPGHVHEGVENWLETHVPGSSITHVTDKEDLVATTEWDKATELTMTGTHAPLLIKDPKHVAGTILAGLSTMTPGSAVVLQLIVFRAEPQSPRLHKDSRHDASEHKAKVSDATFKATIRIAARGEEAKRLIRDVYAGLSVTHTFGVKFVPRPVLGSIPKRVNRRAGIFDYRILLNAPELVVVMGWPFDSMNVPGLGGARARRLAPDLSIPEAGPGTINLAASNYPKTRGRTLAWPTSSIPKHMWIIGPTDSGKSTVLENQAAQAMAAGLGLIVIEPKGDLARAVLSHVPRSRVDDVIWFDPKDLERPIGFNMLAGPDPERTALHVVSLFKGIYGDSWGPRLEMILKRAVYTAAVNGLTIYDAKVLLEDPAFRASYVRKVKDIDTRRFWRNFDAHSDIAGASVINKLDAFAGTSILRNIVGQTKSLDMEDVIMNNKILLVPLEEVPIGKPNAEMLGSMLVDQIWMQARRRPEGNRPPILTIVDEVQKFTRTSVALGDVLAMARSYGLGFTLAHQHMAQDGIPAILPDLKSNARTKMAFALAPDDADKLKEYFSPLSGADLKTLAKHEVAMSIMTETGLAGTVTGKTYGPPTPTGAGPLAQRISRATYGTPRAQVEREIASRHKDPDENRKRPTIGKVQDEG